MSNIESFYNEWLVKLQLEQYPIELHILNEREEISLNRSGYKAKIRWNYNNNTWELLLPKNIEETIMIHELGHLYFPKKVGDMRLAPRLKNIEEERKLNYEIGFCLNQLIDCFVNHYLSEFNDYYKSWVEIMLKDLNIKIPRQNRLSWKLAFYLLHYIQYNYLFRENDKLNNISKINALLTYSENMIILKHNGENTIINRQKLNQLKSSLDQFNLLKESKDSRKLMFFMFEVIKNLKLWDRNIVLDHFKTRFKTKFL